MTDTHTALIIGANRGIGLGLVKQLAARGWAVTATARNPDAAKDLNSLASENKDVVVESVDTADAASCTALRDRLAGQVFDLLIVNAGVSGPAKTPRNVEREEFADLFITNSLAPVRLGEMLMINVRPETGVIGMMTSQLGSVEQASAGGMELYRASKAALNSFTRSFAARHRDKKIAILSLHPGWVRTDMGGPNATVSIEDSTSGLIGVIERARADRQDGYFDYTGATLPW